MILLSPCFSTRMNWGTASNYSKCCRLKYKFSRVDEVVKSICLYYKIITCIYFIIYKHSVLKEFGTCRNITFYIYMYLLFDAMCCS